MSLLFLNNFARQQMRLLNEDENVDFLRTLGILSPKACLPNRGTLSETMHLATLSDDLFISTLYDFVKDKELNEGVSFDEFKKKIEESPAYIPQGAKLGKGGILPAGRVSEDVKRMRSGEGGTPNSLS